MIKFNEKSGIFKLDTKNTSYCFGIYKANVLMHLYWGAKLPDGADFDQYILVQTKALSPQDIGLEGWSTNVARMEYPTHGSVDLRNPAFECTFDDGSACPQLRYVGHRIYDGKKKRIVLPSSEDFEDFHIGLLKAIDTLSSLIDKSPTDIAEELKSVYCDRLQFRVKSPVSAAGKLPLAYAAQCIEGLKNLILYSAHNCLYCN
jgi:alpha-galactosidase